MAKSANAHQFTIGADELAKGLGISTTKLYKIVELFDKDSKDEWELKEEEHFVWLIRAKKTRLFSEFGAFAIAKYLDATQPQGVWQKCKEFIFGHKAKLRHSFVRKQILNNSSSFIVRNGQGYLSKKDTLNILLTSYPRLNKAFTDLKTSEMSMQIDKDFADIEDQRYYSFTGIYRIAHILSQELKSKDRQAWCTAITVSGAKVMKVMLDEQSKIENRIKSAKEATKKKDGHKCQVTGKKSTPANPIDITAHHIFCRHYYPDLATSSDNLITMTEAIHRDFHAWNGGSQKCCTAKELMEFITLHYPNADAISMRLHKTSKIYAHLQPRNPSKELVVSKK